MAVSQKSMTQGTIWKQMVIFALPIFFSNLFQQLYNAADSLIVGNFLGSEALAAVSSSGNLIFMMIGLFNGIALGAGVVISRYFGAQDHENLRIAIHTDVAFGLIMSVILTVLGVVLAPFILELMGTPETVMPESLKYFRVYFAGALGLVMYNIFVGILQSLGDSKHPLYYLIISSLINIVLDYVLIAWFEMGVEAAAFATILSQFVSAFLCMRLLHKSQESYQLSFREVRINKEMLKEILRNGIPSGIQNSITGVANVVVQSNINAFGAMAMAGCGAYSKIEGFAFLPIMSFNNAITTFVGQNLGARQEKRAQKGAIFGIVCSVVIAEMIGIGTVLFANQLILLFDNNPEVISFGVARSQIAGFFFCLLAFTHAISAVKRGAGQLDRA
jgi:putative MATE family efflux protein